MSIPESCRDCKYCYHAATPLSYKCGMLGKYVPDDPSVLLPDCPLVATQEREESNHTLGNH